MGPDDVLLGFRPGDRLVFKCAQRLTAEQAEVIKARIREAFGDDLQFIVVDKSWSLTVLREEDQ